MLTVDIGISTYLLLRNCVIVFHTFLYYVICIHILRLTLSDLVLHVHEEMRLSDHGL